MHVTSSKGVGARGATRGGGGESKNSPINKIYTSRKGLDIADVTCKVNFNFTLFQEVEQLKVY